MATGSVRIDPAAPRVGLVGATDRVGSPGPAPPAGCPAGPFYRDSAAIGLGCGLVEGLIAATWQVLGQRVAHPDLWVNWHAPWMAPLAMLLLAVAAGVPIRLAARVVPRTAERLGPMLLIALGAWSALAAVPGLNPWAARCLVAGLAYRLGGRIRLGAVLDGRTARRVGLAGVGLWLVLLVAFGPRPGLTRTAPALAATAGAGATNVVLVVLDTVRAESLSLYGAGRPTSPKLAAWARRGVRFEQARSTAPFTLGTHASLFTGRPMSQTSARVDAALDGTHPTLAEHLRARGYATAGFVGNIFYGSAHYGLGRGFDVYRDLPGDLTRRITPRELLRSCGLGAGLLTWFERKWRILEPMQRLRYDAQALNRDALAWLDGPLERQQPFFLFLNYFDAHAPYSLPGSAPQHHARQTGDRLERRLKELKAVEGSDAPGDLAFRDQVHAEVRDAYDDGIAWLDGQLDALLGELDRRGALANTLVVITADHGEMLGEHGQFGHGLSLARPVVHVPLVVIGPSELGLPAGAAISEPVSVRDVPATVLHLISDPQPVRFPGRSLARFWAEVPGGDGPVEPVLTEVEHMPWMPRRATSPVAFGPMWLLTEGRWSYHRQEHETLGLVEHLYDLESDPGEEQDLAPEPSHRDTLRTLRARFQAVDPGPLTGAAGGSRPPAAEPHAH